MRLSVSVIAGPSSPSLAGPGRSDSYCADLTDGAPNPLLKLDSESSVYLPQLGTHIHTYIHTY